MSYLDRLESAATHTAARLPRRASAPALHVDDTNADRVVEWLRALAPSPGPAAQHRRATSADGTAWPMKHELAEVTSTTRVQEMLRQLDCLALDAPTQQTAADVFTVYTDCYTRLAQTPWLPALMQLLLSSPASALAAAGAARDVDDDADDDGEGDAISDEDVARVVAEIYAVHPAVDELATPADDPIWHAHEGAPERVEALRRVYLAERTRLRLVLLASHQKRSTVVGFPLPVAADPQLERQLARVLATQYLRELGKLQARVAEVLAGFAAPGADRARTATGTSTAAQRAMKRFPPAVTRALLQAYRANAYPDEIERHALAQRLGLSLKQVHHWFTNKRMRARNAAASAQATAAHAAA